MTYICDMTEIWKDAVGYRGLYQVSDLGRVRSLTRTVKCADGRTRTFKGKIMNPTKGGNGYYTVKLSVLGQTKTETVHSMVAKAFLPKPLSPALEVCHKDGTRSNNELTNLRWDTRKANAADRHDHGTFTVSRKLAAEIRGRYKPYCSKNGASAMSKEYDLSKTTIFNILCHRTNV
jgi:hypothetical protein